ncbi:hypothetical protein ACIQOU_21035 [Streptomyces sp. NPDC091279]|uniref:hypothetical protein n=1 Tax=Streptomyces sp. NPDC091279 TaxID=3365983 RepID=UPI0038094059
MKRRTLPAAAALAATAALLLTACGSEDDSSKTNDKIAGSDSASATPSVSPSSSADDTTRPKVTLPSDVHNIYEGWTSNDPAEAAALADAKRRIDATDAAITGDDLNSKAIPFYYTGDALLGAAKWIKGYTDDDYTVTGTTRYYNPQLSKYSKSAVGLIYCSDEGKAFDKNRKTGKVEKSAVTKDSYVLYNTRLDKNRDGIWQTSKLISVRGDEKCTP